jgi:hypothetical protein
VALRGISQSIVLADRDLELLLACPVLSGMESKEPEQGSLNSIYNTFQCQLKALTCE